MIADRTNIDLRRGLCTFLIVVMNANAANSELAACIAHRLLDGFARAQHAMIIDAIADALSRSRYIRERASDEERHALHERIRRLPRPGFHTLRLAAQI